MVNFIYLETRLLLFWLKFFCMAEFLVSLIVIDGIIDFHGGVND